MILEKLFALKVSAEVSVNLAEISVSAETDFICFGRSLLVMKICRLFYSTDGGHFYPNLKVDLAHLFEEVSPLGL